MRFKLMVILAMFILSTLFGGVGVAQDMRRSYDLVLAGGFDSKSVSIRRDQRH